LIKNASVCCGTKILINNTNIFLNGKGIICNSLETLRIYCPINKMNGCEWIGLRMEIDKHVQKCQQSYCECIYGCGQIISINDTYHLDTCSAFATWINNLTTNNSIDIKITAYIKHTSMKLDRIQNQIDNLTQQKICDEKIITDTHNTEIELKKIRNNSKTDTHNTEIELKKILNNSKTELQLRYICRSGMITKFNKYLETFQVSDDDYDDFIKIKNIWFDDTKVKIKVVGGTTTTPKYLPDIKNEYAINNKIFQLIINNYYEAIVSINII